MAADIPLPLPPARRPALGRDDFLVTPANAEAVAWIDRWPDWPGPALAIHGPRGCGKTHLAHVLLAMSQGRLLSRAALAEVDPVELFDAHAACVVEDWDRDPAPSDERHLLHLLNAARNADRHVLLTGRTPPGRWPVRLPDLASRLEAVPAAAVDAPDDELVTALLHKLFADRQLRVEAEVVAYLTARMERSFDAARVLVSALDQAALSERRRVTVPLAREVLAREKVGKNE